MVGALAGLQWAVPSGEATAVVLDVDGDAGFESLRALEHRHGALPRTLSTKTPGGGSHFYFAPEAAVRNSVGQLGEGIDVRGQGGYVLIPPSSIGGRSYVVDEVAPLALMPAWMASTPVNGKATSSGEWAELLRAGLTEGQRNDGLARIVGHLLRRNVDVDVVLELARALSGGRQRAALSAREVATVVESIAGRELRRRGCRP